MYRNALGLLGGITYQYDPAGNRIGVGGTFARTLLPDAVTTSTYDTGNRQLAFGTSTMSFDDNGNLATLTDAGGTTTLTWDGRNRLTAMAGPSVNGSFAYDGLGRRARKMINGLLTQFQYDGLDLVRESSGGSDVAYLRTLSIDEALSRIDAIEAVHLLADALGSTVALSDATGALATSYTYEPFGRTAVAGAPNANSHQYTGRENDLAGIYYYRARYYKPIFHRFLSEDPILAPITGSALSLLAGCRNTEANVWLLPLLIRSTQSDIPHLLNSYAYVANRPLSMRDPKGLTPDAACLGRCRLAYFILCDLFCAPFLEAGPAWVACNAACFYASELVCHRICGKK
jgi:RHS repeat-associated protein